MRSSPVSPAHTAAPWSPAVGVMRLRNPGCGFSRAVRAASPGACLHPHRLHTEPATSSPPSCRSRPCSCLLPAVCSSPGSRRMDFPPWALARQGGKGHIPEKGHKGKTHSNDQGKVQPLSYDEQHAWGGLELGNRPGPQVLGAQEWSDPSDLHTHSPGGGVRG